MRHLSERGRYEQINKVNAVLRRLILNISCCYSSDRKPLSSQWSCGRDESRCITTLKNATSSHRHSLNNPCELQGSGVAAGQHTFVDAQRQSGLDIKKQQRGEVSDPFGTVCPLSAVPSRGPELLRRADQDISVSVAALVLRSFSSLSCDNVSVVQLNRQTRIIGATLRVAHAGGCREACRS
jgi:hypothetical protein